MILFDSVPCDVSCPDAVRSLLVLGVVHTCESVGMKESTLVINVNRPFMLRRPACLLAYISQTNMWPLLLNTLLVGQKKPLIPPIVFGILDLYPPHRQACRGSTLVINAGSFIVTTLPQIGLLPQIGESWFPQVFPK